MTKAEKYLIQCAEDWQDCKMALKANKASELPDEVKKEIRKDLGFNYDHAKAALSFAVRDLRRERKGEITNE